jgi:hypothetical protein
MISLIFVAAVALSGCTAAGVAADVAGSVISTTAAVTGAVISGAAHTVSGSSKSDRDKD